MQKFLSLSLVVLLFTAVCTPAERAKLGVPILTQADAIAMTLAQAAGWCESHGADQAAVADAKKAIDEKDLARAVEVIRAILQKSAASGEKIPPEVVGFVDTAAGALAAEAVQNGMRALSGAADDAGTPLDRRH